MKQIEGKSCFRLLTAAVKTCAVVATLCLVQPSAVSAASYHTLVNTYSWTYWTNAYPWGATHNGSAYMLSSQVSLAGSSMSLHAQSTTAYSGYRFKSGTITAKQKVTCNSTTNYWFLEGYFKCSTVSGSWPAFWLCGAWTWPPEADIMEFKGTSYCWQNTFTGNSWSNQVVSAKTNYVSDAYGTWHKYRLDITYKSSTYVYLDYYIDGTWKKRDLGDFTGKPMYIIIDFQTDGSSGYATWTDKYLYGGAISIGATY
jgi:hypothetical protein